MSAATAPFEYTVAVNQKAQETGIPKNYIVIINEMCHYGFIAHFFSPFDISGSNLCRAINVSNLVIICRFLLVNSPQSGQSTLHQFLL